MSDLWFPPRLRDQRFAVGFSKNDLSFKTTCSGLLYHQRTENDILSSGQSEIVNDSKKFEIRLDISQFKTEEVEAKIINGFLHVCGEHELQQDEHGLVSRKFTRKYKLPLDVDLDTVKLFRKADILIVDAPKKSPNDYERLLKISTAPIQNGI